LRRYTLGQMLSALQAGGAAARYLLLLPPAAQTQLFSGLADTPLCDLYADETDAGFTGHCPAAGTLVGWCMVGWCRLNP